MRHGHIAFLWLEFWRLRLIHYLILGFGCWGVAQGIDFVEGLDNVDALYDWVKDKAGIDRMYGVTHSFKLVEEVLEMLGTTLLWVGFLYYLAYATNGMEFRLRFDRAAR